MLNHDFCLFAEWQYNVIKLLGGSVCKVMVQCAQSRLLSVCRVTVQCDQMFFLLLSVCKMTVQCAQS